MGLKHPNLLGALDLDYELYPFLFQHPTKFIDQLVRYYLEGTLQLASCTISVKFTTLLTFSTFLPFFCQISRACDKTFPIFDFHVVQLSFSFIYLLFVKIYQINMINCMYINLNANTLFIISFKFVKNHKIIYKFHW